MKKLIIVTIALPILVVLGFVIAPLMVLVVLERIKSWFLTECNRLYIKEEL